MKQNSKKPYKTNDFQCQTLRIQGDMIHVFHPELPYYAYFVFITNFIATFKYFWSYVM